MTQDRIPTSDALGAMIITDVLERWPKTADVFHSRAMACVGCAVAPFYTINDASLVYRLAQDEFLEELLAVIRATCEARVTDNERVI